MDIQLDPLAAAIREKKALLFAGGGLSQNLGLPNFSELIRHILSEMHFESSEYHLDDYPVIAESYVLTEGKIGALRSWMDTTWHPASVDVSQSDVHNLILDLDFPVIYTTNYDRWLEAAYQARGKPYHKIASVADLVRSDGKQTEIVKFHGDFDDDDSIVLTEASYFARMSFESPLDLRLRSDSLARTLLFLGYSLHDINTRYLLYKLQQLWENSAWAQQRPPSYILMTEKSPAQEIVLRQRGIQPIYWEGSDPGVATASFLRELLRMARNEAPPPATKHRRARATHPGHRKPKQK